MVVGCRSARSPLGAGKALHHQARVRLLHGLEGKGRGERAQLQRPHLSKLHQALWSKSGRGDHQ